MVKVVVLGDKVDSDHLLGTYLDKSHYDTLIDEDIDVYMQPNCDLVTKSLCDGDCNSCDVGRDNPASHLNSGKAGSPKKNKMAHIVVFASLQQNLKTEAWQLDRKARNFKTGIG